MGIRSVVHINRGASGDAPTTSDEVFVGDKGCTGRDCGAQTHAFHEDSYEIK